jgi:predicted O-methyltransferase YrrM
MPAKKITKQNTLLEDSYFDLIIKTILNEVYHPGEHVDEGRVWPECQAMSMIGKRRLENVLNLAKEKIEHGIPGDFIEAGIWKGGVVALMSAVLKVYGDTARQVYGADSFKGIPPAKPDLYPADEAHIGCDELEILSNNSRVEVESLLQRFGLLSPQVTLVEGWFKDTLETIPNENFALIRLDGDSYESTMQALQALYPKLSDGGSIIIDDYYSWEGCKAAVDEWREDHEIKEPLVDIDWTGVYWTKSSAPDAERTKIFNTLDKRSVTTSKVELQSVIKEGLLAAPRVVVPSAWIGHLPFLTSLIGALKPRRHVELGVHNGYSLFGAAQAVETHGLDTEVIGVDLWMGDEHAGFFNAEVYNNFIEMRSKHFPSIEIIRQDFNNAVHLFGEQSIDLLHIDGLHTYDAVKSDFEAWIPKVSTGGVVLFHDTKVYSDGFGVWKIWEELQQDYICHEFPHFHGLGVLINLHPDKRKAYKISELFSPDSMTRFERAGENLGKTCHAYFNEQKLQSQVRELTVQRQHILNENQARAVELEREALLRGQIAEKITSLEEDNEHHKVALEEAKNHAEQLQQQLDDRNTQLHTAERDKETLVAQVETLRLDMAKNMAEVQTLVDSKSKELESAIERQSLLREQLDDSNTRLQASDKDKQALAAQVASLQANVDERFEELAKLSQLLTEIEDSRLASKLRSAGKLLRPWKS